LQRSLWISFSLFVFAVISHLLSPFLFLLPFAFVSNRYGAKSGAWALVTGASDGIGHAFAIEMAKRGFNVFISARSEDKLQARAQTIAEKYNVRAKFIVADASKVDASIKKIVDTIGDGMCPRFPSFFVHCLFISYNRSVFQIRKTSCFDQQRWCFFQISYQVDRYD
jgi:hypothetical protein